MGKTIEIDESVLAVELEKATHGLMQALKKAQEPSTAMRSVKSAVNGNTPVTMGATRQVGKAITMTGLEPINKSEFASISTLVDWVADNQNIKPETVQEIIKDELGIDHITKIHRSDFQRAVDYLVEMQTDLNALSKRVLN